MNEECAVDISRKIGSQIQVAMKEGICIGGSSPYGYVRSSEDRHKFVIDGPTVAIIQQIFEWDSRAIKTHEVARYMNTTNTLPSVLTGTVKRKNKCVILCARAVDRIFLNWSANRRKDEVGALYEIRSVA